MFIEPPGNESTKRTNAGRPGVAGTLCAVALIVAGCDGGSGDAVCGDQICAASETAASCAEDCGCGNGVVNPGEACDGGDLGDATCESAVQRGGLLGCNADCTLDVSGCTLPICGNGVAESGESCDGADLGAATCASIGYSGGTIACDPDCAYDVSPCCNDACLSEGAATCVGNILRTCAVATSGCLDWQVTDCAATNDVCAGGAGTAACTCVDRCPAADVARCEGASVEVCGLQPDGCLDWTSSTDCGATGEVCAIASSGPTCVADATAEDCSDPNPLSAGENVVAWTALGADYLTSQPSCNTTTMTGPDLVLSYTAPEDGFATITMNKPASARQVIVASSAPCGMVAPELACVSDFSPTTLSFDLGVSAATTYYLYVRDTTSGTAPLDNPLIVTIDEALCSSISLTVGNLSPAHASSVPDLTPVMSADFDYPADPGAGVITVTGDLGTNITYDLTTAPSQIAFVNGGRTLVIDPGVVLPAGETVTVSWTGLLDATCGTAIVAPAWTFQVAGPPCAPGVGGMVGNTVTRIATGISSITEYYVAADTDPNGYVYVGGTTQLYRTPKAGGATQDVALAAFLTSSQLGYDMLIAGNDIFTLDSSTTATTGVLWRISTTGGASWAIENYMQLPQVPNDDLRTTTYYNGRIYMTTDEFSTGTQIWSVAAASTVLPEPAVLEATIPVEYYCNGLALDDTYYYLACSNLDRLLRIDRTTLVPALLTDTIDINITSNALHAHDLDSNGTADVLYVSSYHEQVHYICDPDAAGPVLVDVLANFGTGTANYGLGFDPVANALWMFDDDTKELVKIE